MIRLTIDTINNRTLERTDSMRNPVIYFIICLRISKLNLKQFQHGVGKKPGSDWLGFSYFKKFIKSKKLAGFFGKKN